MWCHRHLIKHVSNINWYNWYGNSESSNCFGILQVWSCRWWSWACLSWVKSWRQFGQLLQCHAAGKKTCCWKKWHFLMEERKWKIWILLVLGPWDLTQMKLDYFWKDLGKLLGIWIFNSPKRPKNTIAKIVIRARDKDVKNLTAIDHPGDKEWFFLSTNHVCWPPIPHHTLRMTCCFQCWGCFWRCVLGRLQNAVCGARAGAAVLGRIIGVFACDIQVLLSWAHFYSLKIIFTCTLHGVPKFESTSKILYWFFG